MVEEKIKIHSIRYNLVMNIILKISSYIFPLITFPYISRVLLTEGNGRITFAAGVISYFSVFASLGIPTYGVKVCAEVRDDREKLTRTVQELLIINLICVAISYTVFFVLLNTVPRFMQDKTLLIIEASAILLNAIGVEWFYQSIEQYDYITVRNIGMKLISVVLMFLFVHQPADYLIYAMISIIGTYGANILNVFRLHHYIRLRPVGNYHFKKHLKPIFMLFLYSAAITIYTNLDSVMLGFMSTNNEVGLYGAAVKLKNVLAALITSLGSVSMPRISYYLKNNKNAEYKKLIKKSIQFVMFLAVPLSVYCVLEAEPIIRFLASDAFMEAAAAMQWITPSIIFIGLTSVTTWQMLMPAGEDKITVYGALAGAVIDLILNTILIPKYGAAGAALGTLCAEAGVLLVHSLYLKDRFWKNFNWKDTSLIILSASASALIMCLFEKLITAVPFLHIVITGLGFFGFYILINYLTGGEMVKSVLVSIRQKMHHESVEEKH